MQMSREQYLKQFERKRARIVELLKTGMRQADIARKVGVSNARIGQIKKSIQEATK